MIYPGNVFCYSKTLPGAYVLTSCENALELFYILKSDFIQNSGTQKDPMSVSSHIMENSGINSY